MSNGSGRRLNIITAVVGCQVAQTAPSAGSCPGSIEMTDETRNSLIRREAIAEHQGRELVLDRNQVEEMHLVLLQAKGAR